ncbi:hypothetical protein TNCV_417911 [Trichonephila clavipes]|nr:hypothetical protein TNCV_417911 [Trichonephila clavipes]
MRHDAVDFPYHENPPTWAGVEPATERFQLIHVATVPTGHGLEFVASVVESYICILIPLKTLHVAGLMHRIKTVVAQIPHVGVVWFAEYDSSSVILVT